MAASPCALPPSANSCVEKICEAALPWAEVYRRAVDQQRIMFLIGDKNRARGFKPAACADVVKSLIRENQPSRRTPASA
jgi:hypothetical protein